MKKIFILLILVSSMAMQSYSQPTATVTVENPRIVGTQFLFDVYLERTNSDAGWFHFTGPTTAALGNSSWWFTVNTSGLNTPTVVYENPTYIQGLYTNIININLGKIALTTTLSAPPINLPLNQMFHAYTISSTISNATLQSQVDWDQLNTGLVTWNAGAISVTETYYTSDCDVVLNTNCWTGITDGDWDVGTNWSPNGVPSGVDIIYPNNPTTALSVFNVSPFATLQNLRVNHFAQMIIPQNHGITVTGTTELKGGNNLVISSVDGVFPLGGTGSYIPQGAINYTAYSLEAGHIEVQRYIDHEVNPGLYYHHQVAAPVGGVVLDDWDIIPGSTYAYEFQGTNTPGQEWFNIYAPTRQTPSGYGLLLSSYNTVATHTISFYDNLETGSVVVNTDVSPAYNLLGNPYTSPIDWVTLSGKAGVSNTVYIWNPNTNAYVSYVTGTGGDPSAQYIQLGQSFFMQTSNATFQFDATDRVHNVAPYLKEDYTNYMKIYTEGGNSTSDEQFIRFKDGEVTGGYDENHDAMDWPNIYYGELATEIYT
ncbi:MAG: hypothetical protein KAR09_04040, partial [Bacteroidales bacterium]|nr:hypothetical protein [Bacteroidales bacterium]